jgi:hypothetical protein
MNGLTGAGAATFAARAMRLRAPRLDFIPDILIVSAMAFGL